MAKQFMAKRADLTLELETLDGKQVTLTSKKVSLDDYKALLKVLDGVDADELEKAIKSAESGNGDKSKMMKTATASMDLTCRAIDYFYEQTPEWWSKNFDPATLQEILMYIISELKGSVKN